MKNISFNCLLLLLSLSGIFGMCSKEDAVINEPGTNPVAIQHTRGLLVTRGINGIGVLDSIHFRNTNSSTHPTLFSYNTVYDNPSTGAYVRPRDLWELINAGTNNWHIKNNAGYYLGYEFNANGTGYNKYTITIDLVPGDNHLFVMNKTGSNNFYIQPVANRNVYLNSVSPNVQPPQPAHKYGRFIEGSKQLWFLIP